MSQVQLADVNNDAFFFEGVEKLLEVWFTRRDSNTNNCDLRKLPRHTLDEMMSRVKCEIISFTRTEDMDSYVLSESSMFISRNRFILKTCGTTTPLACLPLLVSCLVQITGYDIVQDLYYSRKNFKRPELQVTPHRTFEEETQMLDTIFPEGRAYCMGSINKADCWYLYTASGKHISSGHKGPKKTENDETLEILMTDLDRDKMDIFYKSSCDSAKEATEKSGINKLVPDVTIDDYLFEPCGYSMNGVSTKVSGGYMTIHITPEPKFSYVSFETNIPQKNYNEIIEKVVKTFGPKQFVLTFFNSVRNSDLGGEKGPVPHCPSYSVSDVQICHLPKHTLTYALYNTTKS